MAKGHTDGRTDGGSDRSADETGTSGRRTFLKTVGVAAAAAVAGGGTLASGALAANGSADSYLSQSGNVTVPKGTYNWSGTQFNVSSGDSFVGGGNPGDVVFDLQSGTFGGDNSGTIQNITVRGSNPSGKAELYLRPGSLTDGFVWPEGAQTGSSRAFKSPETSYSASAMATVRHAAVGYCGNNTGYCDYFPFTVENCVFANNNISNWRAGHAGLSNPTSATTTIKNTTIAVTRSGNTDGSNSLNMRGLRVRQPGNVVVDGCYFVFKNVSGVGTPIELHSGAGGDLTIKNSHFYVESGVGPIIDNSAGYNITINDCTYDSAAGSLNVGASYSGNGFTAQSVTVPLPSEVTGMPAADDIVGIGPGETPWGATGTSSAPGTTSGSGNATSTTTSTSNGGNTTSTSSGGNTPTTSTSNGGNSTTTSGGSGNASALSRSPTTKSKSCKPGSGTN